MNGAARRIYGLGCALALLAASAGAETERVKLVYRASSSCPGEEEFVAEVGRRLTEPWLAPPSELARVLDVRLTTDAAQSRGELAYLTATGERARRSLSASNCRDLFSAMVLVTVLAIQSGFEAEPETPSAGAPTPEPVATPTTNADSPRRAVPPRSAPARGIAARAAARLLLSGAVGPEPAAGLGSTVELGPRGAGWAAHAGVATFRTGKVDTGAGRRAEFDLQLAELGICPELGGETVAVVVCGLAQVGRLSGRGVRAPPLVASVDEAHRLWLALAVEPRLELRAEFLALHVAPALVIPVSRPEFRFASPDSLAHRVPAVSWGAGAGVGVQFP